MPKKGDILLNCYNEFPEYYETYKNRLRELEREFLHAKNDKEDYLEDVIKEFAEKENSLVMKFYEIELIHKSRINGVRDEYTDHFTILQKDTLEHNQNVDELYLEEDRIFESILTQFEDRKAEAFNTYLNLTKENDYQIDREMKVHKNFIDIEAEKLDAKFIEYQDLNSTLANKLLWTMEKAKNSLSKLTTSLLEEGANNKEYLDETIDLSLTHLNDSREAMAALFKTSTANFEKERNNIRAISKEKRKPHSELNQKMIQTFVKQIREVNYNRNSFDKMIKKELELSISRLYPKIIESDATSNLDDLKKYILQKEIIENKAEYLLSRSQSMSDLLISKYQNEIKKIKIDSFKRFEEINLAYETPAAFFQNSINTYSNFAFYFQETYEDLYRMLSSFKQYNKEYIKYKADYIHTSQKSFEDYKINLLVKVNEITNNLTEYISRIDKLSHDIVTLESYNRLEIAEIKKRMENLDVFGDYQKYIASLENDQFFAMFQHSKNIEKIQIESNYKNNLLDINREVLLMNQNKLEFNQYQDYMIKLANHERDVQEHAHLRKIEESKALYRQKIDQALTMSALAKHKIIFNARKTNYGYAQSYITYLQNERKNNSVGSHEVVDFVNHVQKIIDVNISQTNSVKNYLHTSSEDHLFVRALERDKNDLLMQIDNTSEKKNRICNKACDVYQRDIDSYRKEFNAMLNKRHYALKKQLLLLDNEAINEVMRNSEAGLYQEITYTIEFIYKQISDIAYKYQIPKSIKKIDNYSQLLLEKFLVKNQKTFRRPITTKNILKSKRRLDKYYIETLVLLERFNEFISKELSIILDTATKNDRLFIANTLKKATITKNIISIEYEKLEFQALKNEKSMKKQLNILSKRSNSLNNLYKNQVKDINLEYLNKVKKSDEIASIIYKKFTKIVHTNNKEMNSMLKYMDKLIIKENKQLHSQYDKFRKVLERLEVENQLGTVKEIAYINTLYDNRYQDASKTIGVLEDRINYLPVVRKNSYMAIKKEKNELQIIKTKELNKRFAEIEKDKFVSRPKYLDEIENVKKRLPSDYIQLYGEIQKVEYDYLSQFIGINAEYDKNYQDYLSSQTGNNELLQSKSPLYMPFDNMRNYFDVMLKQTNQTYKDTLQKSKNTREELKKQATRSQQKQDRIINI